MFFEVKYRHSQKGGGAIYAVDYKKQVQISKVAVYYLYKNYYSINKACRFDVVAFDGLECKWIKNAFPYRGRYR